MEGRGRVIADRMRNAGRPYKERSMTSQGETEDGEYDIVAQDFDGAARDEVERVEHVAAMHKLVARRHVQALELQRQHTQASRRGTCSSQLHTSNYGPLTTSFHMSFLHNSYPLCSARPGPIKK